MQQRLTTAAMMRTLLGCEQAIRPGVSMAAVYAPIWVDRPQAFGLPFPLPYPAPA
jgi:hypothetical protein